MICLRIKNFRLNRYLFKWQKIKKRMIEKMLRWEVETSSKNLFYASSANKKRMQFGLLGMSLGFIAFFCFVLVYAIYFAKMNILAISGILIAGLFIGTVCFFVVKSVLKNSSGNTRVKICYSIGNDGVSKIKGEINDYDLMSKVIKLEKIASNLVPISRANTSFCPFYAIESYRYEQGLIFLKIKLFPKAIYNQIAEFIIVPNNNVEQILDILKSKTQ